MKTGEEDRNRRLGDLNKDKIINQFRTFFWCYTHFCGLVKLRGEKTRLAAFRLQSILSHPLLCSVLLAGVACIYGHVFGGWGGGF